MKYIKKRKNFLLEKKDIIKDNALDILSDNDQNQSSELKNIIDRLDSEVTGNQGVVTRLGPSPTSAYGLHLGNLRTVLYNYLFTKKHNGIMYVRLEDSDEGRFQPGAEDLIRKTLEWLGIEPDYAPWKGGPDGPYRQSERDYTKHTKYLLDNGYAYYAFDTKEDLDNVRKTEPNFLYGSKMRMKMKNSLSLPKEEVDKLMELPYVIRFKVPENKTVVFDDIIRGKVSINSDQMDDKVLIKSSGMVSYHMANVCDDHDMHTTHVIRGEEWIPSTPLHIMLYDAFGWTPPKFAHLPLILNPAPFKGKVSKRQALKMGFPIFPFGGEGLDEDGNPVFFKGFKDEGYDPDALLNFLALLGWSPGDNKEILTMAEMISNFSLEDVHKAGAKFDIDKAKWFNQQYLSTRSDEELFSHIDKGNIYTYTDDKLAQIIDLCRKRSVFTKDLQSTADIFFKKPALNNDDKDKITEDFKKVFSDFESRSSSIEWTVENIKQLIHDLCVEKEVKMGKVMPSLRVCLVSGIAGPDLMTIAEIIGRDETINRIKNV
jgi:nondiscriminating glutamyl-tRNA synthetase